MASRSSGGGLGEGEKLEGLFFPTSLETGALGWRRMHQHLVHAPVAISVVTGPDFVYELANTRYVEMVRREVVGKTFRAAFPEIPHDAPVFAMMREVYATRRAFQADEFRVAFDRGAGVNEDAYFKFSCQPFHDDASDVIDIMTVAVDVTAQVQSRQRIESLNRELQRADRAKDDFLATLAHELRNPMAAIRMALLLLDPAGGDAEQTAKLRETALRQMTNLVRIVDDLLDVARITRGQVEVRREPLDLAAVVQNAVSDTHENWEARGHRLTTAFTPGPFRLRGDATRLEQVVVNILVNASKYTEPGGTITVSLSRDASGGAPGWAVLRVRDTGRGIPPDMLESVFDLFSQVAPPLDRSTGGLGLGLTLVKRLVALHGGRVEALSDGPGTGSEFVVRLPLEDIDDPSAGVASATQGSTGRRRVLVVEDTEDLRDMMETFLAGLGHDVIVACDGTEALEKLSRERVDVALVDVGLPGIDGYEVARRVLAEGSSPHPYLVALTGYGGPDVKRKAAAAGFDVHLTKPVDLDALAAVLRRPP